MLDSLKRFFSKNAAEGSKKDPGRSKHDIRVATCALFVEMDRYEHYLMNKLKNLLRLSHDQLINAKLKVLHSS